MNLNEVKKELNERGIFLNKNRGQNFLIDDNVINSLLNNVKISNEDNILEIGAGFGALTKAMLREGGIINAFEIDNKVCNFLKENLVDEKKLTIFHKDFLKSDFFETFDSKCRVISNIPYNISSQILINLFENKEKITDIYLLLQKEVGERLLLKNPALDIGFLTVALQLEFEISKVKIVSKNSFYPVPSVDSIYIKFIPKNSDLDKFQRLKLFEFLKYAFSEKRKKLLSKLRKKYENAETVFKKLNIDENARVESIALSTWLSLFKELR